MTSDAGGDGLAEIDGRSAACAGPRRGRALRPRRQRERRAHAVADPGRRGRAHGGDHRSPARRRLGSARRSCRRPAPSPPRSPPRESAAPRASSRARRRPSPAPRRADSRACAALGLDPVAKAMEGKIAKDGVEFRCGATSGCAQVDILDGLTGGFLPTAIGVNLGTSFFTGSGACSNPDMVLFHELLHVGLGEAHSPFLDRKTFEGLATDRVYSCTDLCFRPGLATKSECATCLGVDRCDSKCSAYADGPNDPPCDVPVDVTATTCPSTACTCCEDCPAGIRCVETMDGHASGPVGSYVRINLPPSWADRSPAGAGVTSPVPDRPPASSRAVSGRRASPTRPPSPAPCRFPSSGYPACAPCRRRRRPSAAGAARHAGQRRRRRGQHADHLSIELHRAHEDGVRHGDHRASPRRGTSGGRSGQPSARSPRRR